MCVQFLTEEIPYGWLVLVLLVFFLAEAVLVVLLAPEVVLGVALVIGTTPARVVALILHFLDSRLVTRSVEVLQHRLVSLPVRVIG